MVKTEPVRILGVGYQGVKRNMGWWPSPVPLHMQVKRGKNSPKMFGGKLVEGRAVVKEMDLIETEIGRVE